ncbi:unnamed protein product [Toxocara canis]|nr:unnamed protein product [Toxocara canis]
MSAEVTRTSSIPTASLSSHLNSFNMGNNNQESGSNSAYSGDEESDSEVLTDRKKKTLKHAAACSSNG